MKEQGRKRKIGTGERLARRSVLRMIHTGGMHNLETSVKRLAKKGLLSRAAKLAVQRQSDQGVPAVWMEKGIVYKVHPNGTKEIIENKGSLSRKITRKKFFIDTK